MASKSSEASREVLNDPEKYYGGSCDDIGDISWTVPTIVLRYPSNIPNLPGHNWANGIAMATPIAHKDALAGVKVQALTLFDLMTNPELLRSAGTYFTDVQTKNTKYNSFLRPQDKPAIWLNKATMDKYRPEMKKFYYDAARYPPYFDQLSIRYPTLRTPRTPTTPTNAAGLVFDWLTWTPPSSARSPSGSTTVSSFVPRPSTSLTTNFMNPLGVATGEFGTTLSGKVTAANDPRQMQFSGKFSF